MFSEKNPAPSIVTASESEARNLWVASFEIQDPFVVFIDVGNGCAYVPNSLSICLRIKVMPDLLLRIAYSSVPLFDPSVPTETKPVTTRTSRL